jgi:FkbM family methyltransferase
MITGLRTLATTLAPPRALHAARMLTHTVLWPFERELRLVPGLLAADRVAIDVGANVGLYAAVLARRSARVLAFEPHPRCASYLRALDLTRCDVIEAAASDRAGTAILRVPVARGREVDALSTLAPRNRFGSMSECSAVRELTVETLRLDMAIAERLPAAAQVGFVKIDVEGHETAVLDGAAGTIGRHRPALLIEIEARHGTDVEGLFASLAGLGYQALALVDGSTPSPIDAERLRSLQPSERLPSHPFRPRDPRYLNNVLFLPDGSKLRKSHRRW